MTGLRLSVAVGDYDRTRPLVDGSVAIDGVDPVFLLLEPEEIFFRAFRHEAFDVCELSLATFAVKQAQGNCPYVGVPVFPSRAFRHTAISVRRDRIAAPEDLRGKRVGVPEYQLTACVWARGLLEDFHGVSPGDMHWVQGGLEEPDRVEKLALDLGDHVRIDRAPPGRSLSAMLRDGELDAIISPRIPSCQRSHPERVGWLFPDPAAAARAYYLQTGIFPIMHLLGVRRTIAEAHPWLPATLLKAFERAKRVALAKLADNSAAKVSLPFLEEHLADAETLMGTDYWPYGFEANRWTLAAFLSQHHRQGLSPRLMDPADLFDAATLESFRI